MKRLACVLSAVTGLLLFTGAARAQEKKTAAPPSLGMHLLIIVPAVQEELKLTDEQKTAVQEIATEARQSLRGLRNLTREERQKKYRETRQMVETKLEKALKEDQNKRLKEIDLQQRGPLTISQKAVAEAVGLTPEQRKGLREISQQFNQESRKIREEQGRGPERQEKIGKARLEAGMKVIKTLTEEQKQAWKKLTGKPFDLSKIERPGR